MQSRRNRVNGLTVAHAAHAGLWADRYLKDQEPDRSSFRTLVAECSSIPQPAAYPTVFARWQDTLQALGACLAERHTVYRLASGHGRESVIETGLTIHHTYGVPTIPGSSLKGVAAAFARQELDPGTWGKDSPAYRTLFGTTASAGYVTFLDALPVPNTPSAPDSWKLRPDVLTVHHTGYYRGEGDAPADWDDPTPIPFLSVAGNFLIAVLPQAGATAWATTALELLTLALAESGVGGKTSSGYGRLVEVKA
jgi:CRISPR-associated protein Cmr6